MDESYSTDELLEVLAESVADTTRARHYLDRVGNALKGATKGEAMVALTFHCWRVLRDIPPEERHIALSAMIRMADPPHGDA